VTSDPTDITVEVAESLRQCGRLIKLTLTGADCNNDSDASLQTALVR